MFRVGRFTRQTPNMAVDLKEMKEYMEFQELVRRRYSVRDYKREPVEKEKLDRILEAARMAPTACNKQVFKIVVIRTAGREAQLKKLYKGDWFAQAPIVIGIYSIPEKDWVRFDGKNYSDVDAAIVMDHVILAAADQGLGTCWIGSFNPEAAKELAGLGKGYEPVVFTPIGYTDGTEPEKIRKQLEEIVVYI